MGVNWVNPFTFKNLRLHGSHWGFCSNRTMQKIRGENPKAIEILIPNRCPNLIPNSLPEISIIYRKLSVQDICVL
jgi:hypothetical protein